MLDVAIAPTADVRALRMRGAWSGALPTQVRGRACLVTRNVFFSAGRALELKVYVPLCSVSVQVAPAGAGRGSWPC